MKAVSCAQLIAQYEREKSVRSPRRLRFSGVAGRDVYNITPDFVWEGEHYIAGRVEKRENELSTVRLFARTGEDAYAAILPELTFQNLQDPFVAVVHGELILGGVQIVCDPLHPERIFSWHTLFYRGKRLENLTLFAEGPSHMKDIRRTFEYHGAEHKTIFCYEKGLPLTVENVRPQSRFHPRCGTSFLFVRRHHQHSGVLAREPARRLVGQSVGAHRPAAAAAAGRRVHQL